jgi:hypothetical protein
MFFHYKEEPLHNVWYRIAVPDQIHTLRNVVCPPLSYRLPLNKLIELCTNLISGSHAHTIWITAAKLSLHELRHVNTLQVWERLHGLTSPPDQCTGDAKEPRKNVRQSLLRCNPDTWVEIPPLDTRRVLEVDWTGVDYRRSAVNRSFPTFLHTLPKYTLVARDSCTTFLRWLTRNDTNSLLSRLSDWKWTHARTVSHRSQHLPNNARLNSTR